jgi:hypothetical protein
MESSCAVSVLSHAWNSPSTRRVWSATHSSSVASRPPAMVAPGSEPPQPGPTRMDVSSLARRADIITFIRGRVRGRRCETLADIRLRAPSACLPARRARSTGGRSSACWCFLPWVHRNVSLRGVGRIQARLGPVRAWGLRERRPRVYGPPRSGPGGERVHVDPGLPDPGLQGGRGGRLRDGALLPALRRSTNGSPSINDRRGLCICLIPQLSLIRPVCLSPACPACGLGLYGAWVARGRAAPCASF